MFDFAVYIDLQIWTSTFLNIIVLCPNADDSGSRQLGAFDVDSETMKRVLQYVTMHFEKDEGDGDDGAFKLKHSEEELKKIDKDFMRVDVKTLHGLLKVWPRLSKMGILTVWHRFIMEHCVATFNKSDFL